MEGAGWIYVEAESDPPGAPGWVIVYPRGGASRPTRRSRGELRHLVETVVTSALTAAGAPF
jgi:hypothetical protein